MVFILCLFKLKYSWFIMLNTAIEQSDSVIYIYMFFFIFFLSHNGILMSILILIEFNLLTYFFLQLVIFLSRFYFFGAVRFKAKLSRKQGGFSYTPGPHTYTDLFPIFNIPSSEWYSQSGIMLWISNSIVHCQYREKQLTFVYKPVSCNLAIIPN